MRHVMRVHRVNLDTLWERLRTDPSLSMRFVGTKQQLADILTKGSFTKIVWDELRELIQTGPGYKKSPERTSKKGQVSGAVAHSATCIEIEKCKSDLAILKHCAKVFQRQVCRNECGKVSLNCIKMDLLDSPAPIAAPASLFCTMPSCSSHLACLAPFGRLDSRNFEPSSSPTLTNSCFVQPRTTMS